MSATADRPTIDADCAALRRALEYVEWAATYSGCGCGAEDYQGCPDCAAEKPGPHEKGCLVGGALGSEPGKALLAEFDDERVKRGKEWRRLRDRVEDLTHERDLWRSLLHRYAYEIDARDDALNAARGRLIQAGEVDAPFLDDGVWLLLVKMAKARNLLDQVAAVLAPAHTPPVEPTRLPSSGDAPP